tara:strand:+ start:37 stop:312 length:276 start_codon:yes stop_codon:yes gene_type:complete
MEEIQERINLLEAEIESLNQPELLYRRPNNTEYEKVTDFLDDVENRLTKLEENCAVIFGNFDVRLKKVEEQSNYVMNWRMSDEYKEAGKRP